MADKRKWRVCKACPGKGYVLDVFGHGKSESIYVPGETLGVYFPRSQLPQKNILETIGDVQMIIPEGIANHEIHVTKQKRFFKSDTTFSLFYSHWDLLPRGGAYFKKGKFVEGTAPRNGIPKNTRSVNEFRNLIQEYFDLKSYELFERFFFVKGLPEDYRNAVAPLWKS